MKIRKIYEKDIENFRSYLIENEKTEETIHKYISEVRRLQLFLSERKEKLTKYSLQEYKEKLKCGFKPQTVNVKLSAVNKFLSFIKLKDLRLKLLHIQRRAFIDESRELTEAEYKRLLDAAKSKNNQRLYNVMVTICGTGIRISELKYITVESLKTGSAEISMKGKERVVLLPKKLRKRLLQYATENNISSGRIFVTKTGKPLDRSNICHDMKKLCELARVSRDKVFPHNLRHLFARSFYKIEKNLAYLADILGHSSIETTRIYIATSAKAHEKKLNEMHLII